MSYGDSAGPLQTTRANIHYHFGNKQRLVEEVLKDYIELTL
jgi:AcrR family transcriptional regulator